LALTLTVSIARRSKSRSPLSFAIVITCENKSINSSLNLFKNFTALAPNRGEFEQMVNKTFKSISDLGFAAIKVTQTHNIQNMLVTLGDQGICCADENTFSVLPAEQKNVVDVTGCGDTVTAVYTLGLLQGLSMVSATKLANDAAGIVVTKFGTATVTPQELDNAN